MIKIFLIFLTIKLLFSVRNNLILEQLFEGTAAEKLVFNDLGSKNTIAGKEILPGGEIRFLTSEEQRVSWEIYNQWWGGEGKVLWITDENVMMSKLKRTAPGHHSEYGVMNVETWESSKNYRIPSSSNGEWWYGWSYYLDPSYPVDDNPDWVIHMQMHDFADGCVDPWGNTEGPRNPMVALSSNSDGMWYIGIRGDSQKCNGDNAKYTRPMESFIIADMRDHLGLWTDFVFHVKWDPLGNDALLEAWMNGLKVLTDTGKEIGFNDDLGSTFNVGAYSYFGGSSASELIVGVDNVRIGNAQATYADVAPDREPITCYDKSNEQNACGVDVGRGYCSEKDKCVCTSDWQGIECDSPICDAPICNPRQFCEAVDTCKCLEGWSGGSCDISLCNPACTGHSECTYPDTCTCVDGWTGVKCDQEEGVCNNPSCNEYQECFSGECVCKNGFSGDDCKVPICSPECNNNQNCSLPNTCSCLKGYIGENCDKRDCNQNFAGLDCKDCAYGWDGELCTIYLLNPGYQWILPVSISSGVLIILILIVILLIIVIYCKVKKKPEPLSNVSMEYTNLSKIESSVEFDDKSKTEL